MTATEQSEQVKKIAVLGGGSAGFLAAFAIKKHLPEIELVVVRSKKMGVIGVGEGTIWSVVNYLHRFLELDHQQFHRMCQPSIKLGIHYIWGPRKSFNYTFAPQLAAPLKGTDVARGYFCKDEFDYADLASALMAHDRVCLKKANGEPYLPAAFAYHLENTLFVSYLEHMAVEWDIDTIDDIVAAVEKDEHGVQALKLESGQRVEADFFVDCSGFRAELIGKAMGEGFVDFNDTLFCDRAIFGGWERRPEDVYHPYTTAETMDAGWSWRIEHDHLVNRGYVFCSSYLSDDEADAEFRRKNPAIKTTNSVSFSPGARRNVWVGNVLALGNAAGFVEPLEATAIGMICDGALSMVRAIKSSGRRITPAVRDTYNRIQTENWSLIRDFLAVHYRFNTRLDTPFWHMCRHETPLGGAQKYTDFYQEVGPDFELLATDLKRDFFGAEGYLSMLVGQDVQYQRDIKLTPQDKHAWRTHKNHLHDSVHSSMTMEQYISHVRGDIETPYGNPLDRYHITSPNKGELSWH